MESNAPQNVIGIRCNNFERCLAISRVGSSRGDERFFGPPNDAEETDEDYSENPDFHMRKLPNV
jgi:hypothetical protein